MKSKILLVALAILLIAPLYGFAPTYAQNIKCEYFYLDSLEISKEVFCNNYPHSEKTLGIFLDKLFDTLKFKDDIDALSYYYYIQIMPTFCKDWEYEKAARNILEHTNWWLEKHYYQYW